MLPSYFNQLNTYHTPQRALIVILSTMSITLIVSHIGNYHLEDLIGWVNGVFVLIYLASMLAAWRLLHAKHRGLVLLGCVFCAAIAIGLWEKMAYATFLFVLFSPMLWLQQKWLTSLRG